MDKELIAQGMGNFVCGLMRGMPITGVMVQSATNLESGATSRLSTILHGAWILLFVVSFPFVLDKIPLSVLASILVIMGFRLINAAGMSRAFRRDGNVAIFWPATAALVFLMGLLTGFGGALAIYAVYYIAVKREAIQP